MELRRTRMFASVIQTGSIGKAAKEFRIAQPALSRQMKALEGDAGVPLLDRAQRGASPTAAGRVFAEATIGIERGLASAVRKARLAHEGRLGHLRLGLGRMALDDPGVGRAILALRSEHPGIELTVLEIGGPLQTSALLRQEVDLTIGTEESPAHRRLERRTLRVELIRTAILPLSHPLANSVDVTPRDLEGLPLLLAGRSSGWMFPQVRTALTGLGFAAPIEHESLETVYGLVAAGLGWMPSARFYEGVAPVGTVAVPLRGLSVELPVVLRWLRGRDSRVMSRAVRTLLRAFKRQQNLRPEETARAWVSPQIAAASSMEPSTDDIASARRIEARHLRAVVAIAFAGSITDAARRLDLTQSAVSRQVAILERILAIPLFDRRGATLMPTAAGEEMRRGASAALTAFADACAAARLAADGIARRCAVGIAPIPVATARVRALLRRRATELPAVSIEVFETGSDLLRASLRERRIDAALMLRFAHLSEEEEFDSLFVAEDPLDSVLVPVNSPLARRTVVLPADLAGVPFVYYPRDASGAPQHAIFAALRGVGLDPSAGPSANGPRAIWRLVADGAGWTLALNSMRAESPAGLIALPLKGFTLHASIQLLHRRGERDPHVLSVISALRGRKEGAHE